MPSWLPSTLTQTQAAQKVDDNCAARDATGKCIRTKGGSTPKPPGTPVACPGGTVFDPTRNKCLPSGSTEARHAAAASAAGTSDGTIALPSTPWYKRWYVWAAAGGVVVLGTAIVVLKRR